MKKYIVTVLGTAYAVKIIPTDMDKQLRKCDGYCDEDMKRIVVDDLTDYDCYEAAARDRRVKQNIRHELIHAFLFESGLGHNFEHKPIGHEETIVDWIALMLPKINDACRKCDAL